MQLEHANITVASIEKAVHFLGVVFPEFKVRGKGEAGRGGKPDRGGRGSGKDRSPRMTHAGRVAPVTTTSTKVLGGWS